MELYNMYDLPLSKDPKWCEVHKKLKNGGTLEGLDGLYLGRDPIIKKIGDYELKPDHCYRTVSKDLYNFYMEKGFILGHDVNDEYEEYESGICNNKGVDWYLGGACPRPRYGTVVIEVPASKEYFFPAIDYGCQMAMDPDVRHFKSSGFRKPVPTSMITKSFDLVELELNLNSSKHR